MIRRIGVSRSGLCYFLIGVVAVWLGGCSRAAKPQAQGPGSIGASAGREAAMGRQNIGQTRTRSGATPASTKPGERSSLQALRQGEKPVTSASNPLKEIYFDYDRYDVRGDARETLRTNAAWLKSNPAVRVQIEGHADERGTSEYNLALGARRAQSAKDYLVTLGITEARVTTISYGEEVPVCNEGAESCWQKNRRARFVPTAPVPGS